MVFTLGLEFEKLGSEINKAPRGKASQLTAQRGQAGRPITAVMYPRYTRLIPQAPLVGKTWEKRSEQRRPLGGSRNRSKELPSIQFPRLGGRRRLGGRGHSGGVVVHVAGHDEGSFSNLRRGQREKAYVSLLGLESGLSLSEQHPSYVIFSAASFLTAGGYPEHGHEGTWLGGAGTQWNRHLFVQRSFQGKGTSLPPSKAAAIRRSGEPCLPPGSH